MPADSDPPAEPHAERDPTDPKEWLRRARSNLIRASTPLSGVYLEDLCFDAQQAAEKAIKAVLIARGIPYPYVHDLADLLTVAARNGVNAPEDVQEAARLTRFAVGSRYPGIEEPVTDDEHRAAVAMAQIVVDWAERQVNDPERDQQDSPQDPNRRGNDGSGST